MTRRRRIATFGAALLLGILAGWWIIPLRQAHRAVAMIASEDADDRQRGWDWLRSPVGDSDQPRAVHHIQQIEASLLGAPDVAVLHGADVLESLEHWSWGARSNSLMLRELRARIDGSTTDQRIAITRMRSAPQRLDVEAMLASVRTLMQRSPPPIALEAFDAIAGWLGRGRIHRLTLESLPGALADLRRRYWLAQAWSSRIPHLQHQESAFVLSSELSVREAQLFFVARQQPGRLHREAAAGDVALQSELPLAYLLRQAGTGEAIALLRDRAADGLAAARLALQAMDHTLESREAERVARDETEPAWRRRLALWRCSGDVASITPMILEQHPADPDGSVYLAALLAERHLAPEQAADFAQRWLQSFDDAEKRAGAILAVLTGTHAALLDKARAAAEGELRILLRIATPGHVTSSDEHASAREMARVAMLAWDDDVDPDMAVCLLAWGEDGVLAQLTELPESIKSAALLQRAVQQRAVLIERFVPDWHEAIGRPLGGDMRGLQLHFDALDALRILQQDALRWDGSERVFSVGRIERVDAPTHSPPGHD